MTTDPELLERLRHCPVGYWSTTELLPMGFHLVIQTDGSGVMAQTGFSGDDVRFDWRLDPGGAFEVRLTGRDDGVEMDAESLDWHSSPYQLRMEEHPWTGEVLPAIEFCGGLLLVEMLWLLVERVPVLYVGEPSRNK